MRNIQALHRLQPQASVGSCISFIFMAPRRSKWNLAQANICKRRHVAKMAEFCGFQKVTRLAKPPIESSLSVMKPISCHQIHGGPGSHERPHVKAVAAVGDGRKASLYMGLVMRTSSPVRLGLPKHHPAHRNIRRQNLLRFHLECRRIRQNWSNGLLDTA